MQKTGLLFIPFSAIHQLGSRFRGLGTRITTIFPGLQYDLSNAQIELSASNYGVAATFSALGFGLFISIFLGIISLIRQFKFPIPVLLPLLSFMVVSIALFLLHIYYPRILSKSVAIKIDRGLVFATRYMLIQVSSGIPLYQTLANVADGDYGQVSREFRKAVSRRVPAQPSQLLLRIWL